MKIKIVEFIKKKGIYGLLSFLIPIIVMGIAYYQIDVIPAAGHNSILASDAYSQYAMFFGSFNNMIRNNQSLFFNWYASLGLNNIAFMSYYLNGIFTPLSLFFENIHMDYFIYYLTLLKFGCLGLGFWVYASETFQISRWKHLVLAISYALMSFSVAYSEITMWFDGLMYLPLVILGVNKLMDEQKPTLLFVSYLMVFISNFYIAFMIGVFSFLYFCARVMTCPKVYKKRILLYLATSLTAGGASMPIIIPTVLDIMSNGESLTEISRVLTKTAAPLSIFIKNMVGVYDSTKYDTVPFIYAGTLILLFCLFFFITKKIDLRTKLAYGSVLGFLFLSFYFEILNLFWHGFHAPNMFLFRFSFSFSFMVLMLAGYGWEKYSRDDFSKMMNIVLAIFGVFMVIKIYTNFQAEKYSYFYTRSFLWSAGALLSYLGLFWLNEKHKINRLCKYLTVGIVMLELWANTAGILRGISNEWSYPEFSGVTDVYENIEELVDYTKSENSDHFYRMENLTAITGNDSFLFGYSGVSMFSSIRNRHSSQYLDKLGYRSRGTNLNISYNNNTLLMDSLLGIKYNLTKEDDALKFGYSPVQKSGEYTLYQNDYVLPLGILTDDRIYQEDAVDNQTKLINHLAGQDENDSMFTFTEAKVVDKQNILIDYQVMGENNIEIAKYNREDKEQSMKVTYEVEVPANKQAYLSIYPVGSAAELGSQKMTAEVNGTVYSSQLARVGQYVSLGCYEQAQKIQVTLTFIHTREADLDKVLTLIKPDVALMDTNQFVSTIEKIKDQGVDIKVEGRKASATVDLSEDRVLMTTIPYDKGWKAYVDGKQVEIPTFKDAFLTIPLKEGKHALQLVYFPYGMALGCWIAGGSILLFIGGSFMLRRKRKQNNNPSSALLSTVGKTPPVITERVAENQKKAVSTEEETTTKEQEPKENSRSSLLSTFQFSEAEENAFDFRLDTRIKEKKDVEGDK